jgi:enolase
MIKTVRAREVLDSRGNPTVEVDLVTEKGPQEHGSWRQAQDNMKPLN